jgi:hypothetical protein
MRVFYNSPDRSTIKTAIGEITMTGTSGKSFEKRLLLCLLTGCMAVSGAIAQYSFFKPLRIECIYDKYGMGPEAEYVVASRNMDLAFFLSGSISVTEADYGSFTIGSRVYPATVDGAGFYISPMENVLLEGVETNNSLALDFGYRIIIFDQFTGFGEAGGLMYTNSYANTTKYGFNFRVGFGFAL